MWNTAARLGLTHWEVQLPLLYIGGAVIAGTVIGLTKPLSRTLPGALVVGSLVAFPLLLVISPIAVQNRTLLDRLGDSALGASRSAERRIRNHGRIARS
jgi:hypothetical protein